MLTVVTNLKGGVGKSTVAFNLAIWLLETGHKTVLFDLDSQLTLSDAVNVRTEEGYQPELKSYTSTHELDRLLDHKSQIEILVDTSCSNMDATLHSIGVADRVVVPVQPSQADIWSTQRFLELAKDRFGENTPEFIAFINRADTHPGVCETEETEQALRLLPGIAYLPHKLYQRTAYRRSFSEGLAVFEMSPLSKAGQEFLRFAEALYN